MNRKARWDEIYGAKASDELSWYQAHPEVSLRLIDDARLDRAARILDVGGGDSLLVDHLLDLGYQEVSVLDISTAALERAQARLGERRDRVAWIEQDVTEFEPETTFDLWHDRALFHFLIGTKDRARYLESMRRSIADDGHLIIATFSPQGPPKCSGLNIMRYSPHDLARLVGAGFQLVETINQTHVTPRWSRQAFVYCRFVRQEA